MSHLPDPNRPSDLPLEPKTAPGRQRWVGFACLAFVIALVISGTAAWVHRIKAAPPPNSSFPPH